MINMSSAIAARNPFGSFRHNGTFPGSLFSQSYSSDSELYCEDSYHLEAPYNSPVHCCSPANDSTHIYINLLDRSDVCTRSDTATSDTLSDATSIYNADYRCGDLDEPCSKPPVFSEHLRPSCPTAQQDHINKVELWLQGVQPVDQSQRHVIQQLSPIPRRKAESAAKRPSTDCSNQTISAQHDQSHVSVNSDASTFMQLPLVYDGVTGHKACKHRAISKKLKRVTKYIHKLMGVHSV